MILASVIKSLGKLWTQLFSGSGTEGMDCGAVTCVNLIQWASHGKIYPIPGLAAWIPGSLGWWVKKVRRIAGNPNRPMLVEGDIFQVLNSNEIQAELHKVGVSRMYAWYNYGKSYTELRLWLEESTSHAAMLAINYGVARANGAPMGSNSFSGGHAIMVTGIQRIRQRVRVKGHWRYPRRYFWAVGDPLFDGRRKPVSLKRYPKGFQKARVFNYRKAAGAFGSGPHGEPRPIGQGRSICVTVVRGN